MDYAKEYPVAMKAIAKWIEMGLLKRKFHIVNGLDAAPSALPLLYSGGNTGKLCVVFFALRELVSYLTLPGPLRFPSTKPQLSSKPCDCMHNLSTDICCTLISFYVHYNIRISNLPFPWHPGMRISLAGPPTGPRESPQYSWANANRSVWFWEVQDTKLRPSSNTPSHRRLVPW